jgi:hypothetical protein
MRAAEMHSARVQAAQASQSAPTKPVEAAATEAMKTTASAVEPTAASTMEAAASTMEATAASTMEATTAEAARQSRRSAYYKGQQNRGQLTCSPHNVPPRRARLCLVVDQTLKLLLMFRRSAGFDQD